MAVANEIADAFEVTIIDDTAVRVGAFRIFAKHLSDAFFDQWQQAGLSIDVGQYIVRCNAGLSGVRKLAPRDTSGRDLKVGIRQHDTGTFAAEFECYRCQIFRRCAHYNTCDIAATRVEDVIEGLLE